MNLKLTHFSTIIIVNKNQEQTQAIRVKTKHLKRIRHYAASLVVLILSLIASIFYLHSRNSQQEKQQQQLLGQIALLKSKLPVTAITADSIKTGNTARSYIQSIQSKLQKINDYLKKRGLKGFSIQNVGGSGKDDNVNLSDNEKYSLYDDYLSRLVNTVAFTPMGYPKLSSLTSVFVYRSDPFDTDNVEFHPGIDFKGRKGDPVKCTANGRVISAGWNEGYGKCIVIKHTNNFETVYGHLSRIEVKVGQLVSVGEIIGKVGSTGHSTGAHLHYEVRKNGKPINPVKFLTLNN